MNSGGDDINKNVPACAPRHEQARHDNFNERHASSMKRRLRKRRQPYLSRWRAILMRYRPCGEKRWREISSRALAIGKRMRGGIVPVLSSLLRETGKWHRHASKYRSSRSNLYAEMRGSRQYYSHKWYFFIISSAEKLEPSTRTSKAYLPARPHYHLKAKVDSSINDAMRETWIDETLYLSIVGCRRADWRVSARAPSTDL